MSPKKFTILILSLFAGIFLLTGLILLVVGWRETQAIDRASTEQVLHNAAQVSQTPPGAVVMLEGKIAERNPPLDQDFIAYIRSQYQGDSCNTDNDNQSVCKSIWIEEKRETPPLWLDLSEGRIRLANTDYQLQNPLIWQSTPGLVKNETIRYEGFKIGNPIFAQGTIVTGDDGSTLKADFLFGGDGQAYFDFRRNSNRTVFLLGAIFTTVGVIIAAILIVLVRRAN